jgi:hypothetical protein
LRESYNNHRKSNRSTSNNGGGPVNNFLIKNFKEKQYDNDDTFERSRASASFDKILGNGKEN